MDYSSIIELEKKLLDHSIRKSTVELNMLLSNEFCEIGSSGRIYDKKIIIERLTQESPSQIEAVDFKTVELAPSVVQIRFKTKRINEGHIVASLRSSIWKHDGVKWQMIFHQGTLTTP